MPEKLQAIMPHGLGWELSAQQEAVRFEEVRRSHARGDVTIYDVSRPSEMGQFVVDAAVALYKRGAVDNNFVVAGSRLFGHALPFSQVLGVHIRQKFPLAHVIDTGNARTTSMEMRRLAKEARRRDWQHVGTVTLGIHQERAALVAEKVSRKRRMRKRGITIQVLKAEDILTDPAMQAKFGQLQASEAFKAFARHERKAIYIEKLHLTSITDLASRIVRPKVMSQ